MEGIGALTVIIDLIRDLLTHTTSACESVMSFPRSSQLPPRFANAVCFSPTSTAVRWLMSGGNHGIRIGSNTFDDLDYADNFVLLPLTPTCAFLERLDEEGAAAWVSTRHKPRPRSKMSAMVVHIQHSLWKLIQWTLSEFIYVFSKVTIDGHSASDRGDAPYIIAV